MKNSIATVKEAALRVLDDPLPGRRFALAQVNDYPSTTGCQGVYGNAGDTPFQVVAGFGEPIPALKAALSSLRTRPPNDADRAEAYLGALQRSFADPAVSWRKGAARAIMIFVDDLAHDPSVHTGVDPGLDGACGTADDVTRADVLAGLAREQIELLVVLSDPAASDRYAQTVQGYWAAVARDANGQLIALSSAPSHAIPVLEQLLWSAPRPYGLVKLDIDRTGSEPWFAANGELPSTPPFYRDVAAPRALTFDLHLTVPPGLAPGVHEIRLVARGDGEELGRALVHFSVPAVPMPPQGCEAAVARFNPDIPGADVEVLARLFRRNGRCPPDHGIRALTILRPNRGSWKVRVDRPAASEERLAAPAPR